MEARNEHFIGDFLQFSYLVARKLTFSTEFSYWSLKICHLKNDVLCQASVNFHHMAQNATPATEFAHCLRQPRRNTTSQVLRLPRKTNMEVSEVLRLQDGMPRRVQVIFWKPCKSSAPVVQNGFWRDETCWNVMKCHASHTKLPIVDRFYLSYL